MQSAFFPKCYSVATRKNLTNFPIKRTSKPRFLTNKQQLGCRNKFENGCNSGYENGNANAIGTGTFAQISSFIAMPVWWDYNTLQMLQPRHPRPFTQMPGYGRGQSGYKLLIFPFFGVN